MKTDLRKVAVVVVERALEEGSVLLGHSLSEDGDRLKMKRKHNSGDMYIILENQPRMVTRSGFLFSYFIRQRGQKISYMYTKTQTLPNLRLPISSEHHPPRRRRRCRPSPPRLWLPSSWRHDLREENNYTDKQHEVLGISGIWKWMSPNLGKI